MSSVNVLCPTGRRQQVKVQSATTTKILDILEEVCKKQGLDASEYELVHGPQRRSLDVSLTYRLTGLPLNAQLELRKIEGSKRQFTNVTVALQLDDGTRLTPHEFKPDEASLCHVLDTFRAENPDRIDIQDNDTEGTYPVCSYLNEQVIGTLQLENTTLKDIGLTNGRGIVRFEAKRRMDRSDKHQLDARFREKLDKRSKLEQIYHQQKQQQQEQEHQAAEMLPEAQAPRSPSQPPQQQPTTSSAMVSSTSSSESDIPRQEVKRTRHEHDDQQSAIIHEQQHRQRQYESQFPVTRAVSSNVVNNEFANFKFPEETKGQKLNDLSEWIEMDKQARQPCDRKALAYIIPTPNDNNEAAATKLDNDLPEDFFNVTLHDLQCMMSDLKKQSTSGDDTMLMTRQMREMEQDRKAMRYPQVAIRIIFKHTLVLQGLFRSKECVSVLYNFVRDNLDSTATTDDLDFYLYTTPPKNILKEDSKKTLFELHLCPAALVYFKNKSDSVPALKASIDRKTLQEANEIVNTDVHKAIRKLETEERSDAMARDALLRENRVVQNILRSGLNAGGATSNRAARGHHDEDEEMREHERRLHESDSDPTKKKLERFLKGSKK